MEILEEFNNSDDLVLIRCVINKDCGDHFKGKDYNGKNYIIMKTEATKRFKKGTDDTFYAIKEVKGLVLKKEVYHPITTKEYESIRKNLGI
ncbi:hypothetical protein [Clostridium hydrogeniformans]|uniref:hypothetical protein n=1 Tax=Clostridium hydrogeniformans TaxID=349933 RepID=UPI0004864A70|nr:hypothetical protein [Clostridium hydrogeniformans]